MRDIYIWGTDERAILTGLNLEQQNLQIKAFIDINADKIGTRIGLPVIFPSDIIYEGTYIYITETDYHKLLNIGNFLENKGLEYGKEQGGFEFLSIYDKDKFKKNSIEPELHSKPLVSVIIPVYNVELYLSQCLDSIINQTYKNLQIICVYDGSTDNSLQILQRYANKDTRIEIINKKNGCLGSARNFAYPYIKGKYTLFVDSDDYIDIDTCKKSVAVAEYNDADITLFFWNAEMKLSSGTTIVLKQLQNFPINCKTKITVEEKMSLKYFADMWNKLWRSDFLKTNELLCPEYIAYEAILPSWKGFILANKIAVVEDVLYHYRIRSNSMTGELRSANIAISKHQFDFLYASKLIEDFLVKSDYFNNYGLEYIEWSIGTCFYLYNNTPDAIKLLFLQQIFLSLSEIDKEFYRKCEFSAYTMKLLTKYFGDKL